MAKDYPRPHFQRKWEQTHYQLKKYDVLQFRKRLVTYLNLVNLKIPTDHLKNMSRRLKQLRH